MQTLSNLQVPNNQDTLLFQCNNPELQKLRVLNDKMDKDAFFLQNAASFLQYAWESCPVPMWVKDTYGRMVFLNDAYCEIYDVDRHDYLGRLDEDVWGEEVAKQFKKLDDNVIRGGRVEYSIEKIPNAKGFRQYDHLNVVKYPIKAGPRIVGVAGMITGVFP